MDGTASTPRPATPPPDWVPRRRLTVRDYHAMGEAGILRREDRVELIEGELIAMSPVGGPHIMSIIRLNRLLVRAVGDQALVSIQSSIRLDDHNEPEPDIALLRHTYDASDGLPPLAPDILLLIEVASTSLRYDRTVKAALYAQHDIGEYWIVDLEARLIRLHRDPAPDGYRTLRAATAGETLEPLALPGLRLAVADMLA